MSDPISPPDSGDLHSLLGAYALDALDTADRARVDEYLAGDAAARAEVDDMLETAASLALLPDTPLDAPPEIWERISQAIAAERAERGGSGPSGAVDELAAQRARRIRPRWIAPVAAAAAIALVLLSVQVARLDGRLNRNPSGTKAVASAFDRAAKVDGARMVGLQSGSGATLARIVLLPDGSGYLRGDHLAPLSSTQTYQLWALTGNATKPTVVSAGVLGPDPAAVTFHASGPVHGFAVTVENAGGVVQSQHAAIASAKLS